MEIFTFGARRISVKRAAYLLSALSALLGAPGTAAAQTAADSSGRSGNYATRTWLEARAAQAEAAASTAKHRGERDAHREEAEALRARLRDGDFQTGDRMAVAIQVLADTSTSADTVTVREGRLITVRNLPEIPLTGVLRAEAEAHVKKAVSQYVKDPAVQVTPLLRVAILGEVSRPGFYSLPADVLVSDAIMAAGGPSSKGDVNKTEIKRESRGKIGTKVVRQAIVQGRTMDQLNVRPGDEIVVGKRLTWDWVTILRGVSAVLALSFAINRIAN